MTMILKGYTSHRWHCDFKAGSRPSQAYRGDKLRHEFIRYSPVFSANFRTCGRPSSREHGRTKIRFEDEVRFFDLGTSRRFDHSLVYGFQEGTIRALPSKMWTATLYLRKIDGVIIHILQGSVKYHQISPYRINMDELDELFTEEGQRAFAEIHDQPYELPEEYT